MSELRIAMEQVRYSTISTLRNPAAVFFGLMLPVVFLLIFATIFGNETIEARGGIKTSTYYVPGLVALGIVSTTFVNLAITLVVLRENRVLKRLRGTPLPVPAFIAGRASSAFGMAIALTWCCSPSGGWPTVSRCPATRSRPSFSASSWGPRPSAASASRSRA